MRLILIAVASLMISACDSPAVAQGDEVTLFSDSDTEMNAAIAEANRTLPSFWAWYEANPDQRAQGMIKVGLEAQGGGREHIWADNITREGGVIRGRLANEPGRLPGMTLGSEVVIEPDHISDWSYEKGDRLWGSYTTRVMLRELPEAEAAEMRAWLSPTPLEGQQP